MISYKSARLCCLVFGYLIRKALPRCGKKKLFSMFSWNVLLNDREVSEKPDGMLDINRTANSFVSR